jgi:hypothetical protein
MIESREMAEFARNLWENYIKVRNHEADANTVSFYKAQVVRNQKNGVLGIRRPLDATVYNVACPSYMEDISVGDQVLVLRFGNDPNLKNHFVVDNAARTMLASAIATGSSIAFPITVANGGTGATTLAGAKTNLGVPEASDDTPLMDGTASAGNLSTFSRGNHRHPSDSTKADKANTVTNVGYDSATGNITQTINGTTTNVAEIATPSAVKEVYDLANSKTYSISMTSNVITLTGQDGSTSSVTLPIYNGSVS